MLSHTHTDMIPGTPSVCELWTCERACLEAERRGQVGCLWACGGGREEKPGGGGGGGGGGAHQYVIAR